MTDKTTKKRRKFAHELLLIIGLCALISLILFIFLVNVTVTAVEMYCFDYNVPMTEFDWMAVDRTIFCTAAVISIICFSILFLALLSKRLAYIRKLTEGIHALPLEASHSPLPLVGNNELTELADAINQMANVQKQVREKEQRLAWEKEQLIRTLSHDIRTPLTSVLAYSEYLMEERNLPAETQKAHLQTIHKKAEQIRDLTDILLDGDSRNKEFFADGRLLMEQLTQEFEAELEDRFQISTDFSRCDSFSGSFDVQQLRRIFDNIGSNIAKYADPAKHVFLFISLHEGVLVIQQTNAVRTDATPIESYGLGIHSIRRIAQLYGGRVTTQKTPFQFSITIELTDF